jgi:NAD(P)-dependent dehydrogenase (short-subunit alcohol dehydrogenase family)
MLFANHAFLVTGAGSGIGEAIAKKLAEEGASVVVADINDHGGERVTAEITGAGGAAVYVHADVSQEDGAQIIIDTALREFGRLDGAANNAGISQPALRIHETDTELWDRVIGVDLRGVFFCMRAELKHFLSVGGGSIVNTASGAGLKAAPLQGAYTAAKHGVVGLTRQAAIEYVRDNIRVNAVAPGLVASQMLLSKSEEEQQLYIAIQPGGRPAEAKEIANGIAWLLSDEASYASGSVLEINAAWRQQ